MTIIKIRNLTKRYKKFEAITDVSFDVPTGAIFGLIGLNGAGKTTTIKSLTGLLKKFEGTIEVGGEVWGTNDYHKKFAFLPELFVPHHFLTGWEYIKFMQELHDASVDKDVVWELCDQLKFTREWLNNKCHTYSKGTMQKLGLIQAICSPAEILILDEPMSGLDPLARSRFRSVVETISKSGRTLLMSTHIMNDIDTMCTHVGILDKGKLIASTTPEELKRKHSAKNMEEAFLKEIES